MELDITCINLNSIDINIEAHINKPIYKEQNKNIFADGCKQVM